jgi:hypothetical protein
MTGEPDVGSPLLDSELSITWSIDIKGLGMKQKSSKIVL